MVLFHQTESIKIYSSRTIPHHFICHVLLEFKYDTLSYLLELERDTMSTRLKSTRLQSTRLQSARQLPVIQSTRQLLVF